MIEENLSRLCSLDPGRRRVDRVHVSVNKKSRP